MIPQTSVLCTTASRVSLDQEPYILPSEKDGSFATTTAPTSLFYSKSITPRGTTATLLWPSSIMKSKITISLAIYLPFLALLLLATIIYACRQRRHSHHRRYRSQGTSPMEHALLQPRIYQSQLSKNEPLLHNALPPKTSTHPQPRTTSELLVEKRLGIARHSLESTPSSEFLAPSTPLASDPLPSSSSPSTILPFQKKDPLPPSVIATTPVVPILKRDTTSGTKADIEGKKTKRAKGVRWGEDEVRQFKPEYVESG